MRYEPSRRRLSHGLTVALTCLTGSLNDFDGYLT